MHEEAAQCNETAHERNERVYPFLAFYKRRKKLDVELATSSANRRIPKNRSEMTNLKQPAATATNFYTRIPNLTTNTRPSQGPTTKSNIVT
ncbi:hypothetical protein IKZ40_08095, partial [bacterium]|nr:hypothetical protein [bacterium]